MWNLCKSQSVVQIWKMQQIVLTEILQLLLLFASLSDSFWCIFYISFWDNSFKSRKISFHPISNQCWMSLLCLLLSHLHSFYDWYISAVRFFQSFGLGYNLLTGKKICKCKKKLIIKDEFISAASDSLSLMEDVKLRKAYSMPPDCSSFSFIWKQICLFLCRTCEGRKALL